MKFVIFDIDGTLTNTKKVEDYCFMKSFYKTFNLDISDQKWENLKNVTDWGITEEIIEQHYRRKPSVKEINSMIDHFTRLLHFERNRDKSQFEEVTGARNFFNMLASKNEYKIGIATGSWEKSALIKLGSINISLNGICFSNSNHYKTREQITLDVIKQLKQSTKSVPDDIIYFGDGVWDFQTCNKLGISFIGIDCENDGILKRIGAKVVFNDYKNIELILREI